MSKVKITNLGIKRLLNRVQPEEAVTEYIWNGFDAGATEVSLDYRLSDQFESVTEFSISDNGRGIPHDLLNKKFSPFWESEKAFKKNEENIGLKGKDGYGRLTFFKFASHAKWSTRFKKDDDVVEVYEIRIESGKLDDYKATRPTEVTETATGTTVSFSGLMSDMHAKYFENKVIPYLVSEFAWFLELNADKNFRILINGQPIAYSHLIAEADSFSLSHTNDHGKVVYAFQCRFVRWNQKLNDEFSRFYFLNADNKLKHKTTTKLNKKGDQFYHSVVVKSDFFENFSFYEEEGENSANNLFSDTDDYKAFRELLKQLNAYLKKKRKPFLHEYANTLIRTYEDEKVMPQFGKNPWDQIRKNEFEALVKELYEVEPALFVKLNFEQKKTFLNLLNLLMDSAERESLFDILSSVVDIEPEDRDRLAKILKTTRLTNIIQSLQLVHDRILTLDQLKKIVFDHTLLANERDHLQKAIENHYWIFGEEYNLVCAAEVKFEKALRKYLYLLRGIDKKTYISHEGKHKEMDIFLVRQDYGSERLNNVVVELKNPTSIKRLTMKELAQVKEYMSTILSVDEFNAGSNSTWHFYLVGQDYDDAILNEISNAQHHGEKDLAFKVNNNRMSYKIYVKKWSEIFIDVELRLKWLNQKLLVERDKLSQESPADVSTSMELLTTSSAVQSGQVVLPSEN